MAMLPAAWRPVANFHYYRGRGLLEPELRHLCQSLAPGDRVIDVGANEGVYTHAFARTGASVEAFEPLAEFAAVLRDYAAHRARVRVHEVALGAIEGTAVLRVPMRGGRPIAGHASLARDDVRGVESTVRVRPLDAFAFEAVRAIKIDVEGHELEVVRGARETIRRWSPTLLVEIEQRHQRQPMAHAFDEILALGYAGFFLHGATGLRPLAEFRVAEHQSGANADRIGALYINNFLFTPVAPG